MKKDTITKLSTFKIVSDEQVLLSEKYKIFEKYLEQTVSGSGMIGECGYLLLWKKSEIEELNNLYETQDFLSNVLLIGSDGGDTAYGIDIKGRYIEVTFIGMDDKVVEVVANDFDGFIDYIWSKK